MGLHKNFCLYGVLSNFNIILEKVLEIKITEKCTIVLNDICNQLEKEVRYRNDLSRYTKGTTLRAH